MIDARPGATSAIAHAPGKRLSQEGFTKARPAEKIDLCQQPLVAGLLPLDLPTGDRAGRILKIGAGLETDADGSADLVGLQAGESEAFELEMIGRPFGAFDQLAPAAPGHERHFRA